MKAKKNKRVKQKNIKNRPINKSMTNAQIQELQSAPQVALVTLPAGTFDNTVTNQQHLLFAQSSFNSPANTKNLGVTKV